jgi:hypothetical protein
MTPVNETFVSYVWPAAALAGGIVTWCIGGLVWMLSLAGRVAVVEQRQHDMVAWLERVERKLDDVLSAGKCILAPPGGK